VLQKLRRRIFRASRARLPGALQGCSRLFGGLRLGSSRRA
jgi:hypothetical protein